MATHAGLFRRHMAITLAVELIVLMIVVVALKAGLSVVPIGTITSNPDHYDRLVVTVRGKVTWGVGIGGIGLMRIYDNTGAIWVKTDGAGAIPPPGVEVRLRGRVHEVLQLGFWSVTAIEAL